MEEKTLGHKEITLLYSQKSPKERGTGTLHRHSTELSILISPSRGLTSPLPGRRFIFRIRERAT